MKQQGNLVAETKPEDWALTTEIAHDAPRGIPTLTRAMWDYFLADDAPLGARDIARNTLESLIDALLNGLTYTQLADLDEALESNPATDMLLILLHRRITIARQR